MYCLRCNILNFLSWSLALRAVLGFALVFKSLSLTFQTALLAGPDLKTRTK